MRSAAPPFGVRPAHVLPASWGCRNGFGGARAAGLAVVVTLLAAQPSWAQRGPVQTAVSAAAVIHAAETGRCAAALPALADWAAAPAAHRLAMGTDYVRCAMLLHHTRQASVALERVQRAYPNGAEVLYLAVHIYSQMASAAPASEVKRGRTNHRTGNSLPQLADARDIDSADPSGAPEPVPPPGLGGNGVGGLSGLDRRLGQSRRQVGLARPGRT